jgi:hypothetical protein
MTNLDPKTIGQDTETTFQARKFTSEHFDAPWFIPGMEKDSEHQFAMPAGAKKAGYFNGLSVTKAEKDSDKKDYVRMTDKAGNKFCVKAGKQLVGILSKIDEGTYIQIEYKGKQEVEGYKQPLHQFEVSTPVQLNN